MTNAATVKQSASSIRLREQLKKIISRRSYCTLASATPDGKPHAVGIMYKFVDGAFYFATGSDTKKAKNVQRNPNVAICIPVRKYPVGPPFSIQFTGTAASLSREDAEIVALLKAGKLKSITGFGVLNEPDLCFIKVKPAPKIHTYGIGVPLRELLKAPAHADRTVVFD